MDRPEPPVEAGAGWSETEIVLPDEAADHPRYCIHPVMLDAALQSLVAAMPAELLKDPTETAYLPVSLATIRVFGHVGRRARCRTELVSPEQEGGGHLGRIVLMDDMGTPTAELTGVELRRIDPGTVSLPLEQKIFDTEWVESSTPSEVGQEISAAPAGSWLLLADDDAETKALVAEFAARFSSPTRRVISEELSDESAVREAVAKTAADPELPAGRHDRIRRKAFVRWHRPGRRASACARVDLGDLGRGARCCRRLAREVAATVVDNP